MARMTVTMPDLLASRVKQMPGLNVSGVLQGALWDLVDCHHGDVACCTCNAPVDLDKLHAEILGLFYADVMERLEMLVARAGTAEGAARVINEVAKRHGCAADRPLPRPTRAERKAVADRRWVDEQSA